MKYSDLGEARILKPAKKPVKQDLMCDPSPAQGWVSLGDALIHYLKDGVRELETQKGRTLPV